MVADRLAAAHEFLTALSLDGSTNLTDTNEKRPNSQGSPTVNISKREEKREDEILSYSSSSFISFPIDRHHTPKKKSESYKYLLKPKPHGVTDYDPSMLSVDYDTENNLIETVGNNNSNHHVGHSFLTHLFSNPHNARATEMKKMLNEHFRTIHPEFAAAKITLSKIRSLKQKLFQVGMLLDLEIVTVGMAITLLEKLILKGAVCKENRQGLAAACLLLATKMIDCKELNYDKLFNAIEEVFDVSAKEVRSQEFPVFIAVNFELCLNLNEYLPHLDSILYNINLENNNNNNSSPTADVPLNRFLNVDTDLRNYLGDKMFSLFVNTNTINEAS